MSSNSLLPINIPKRASRCSLGQELFEPGQEYYSLLTEDEEEEKFIRQDFCLSCWEKCEKKEGKSQWKGRVLFAKKTDKTKGPDIATLFSLLREYMEKNTPETDRCAFVLALYLARKKLLLLRKEIKDGYLYEDASNEEMLYIKKTPLSSEEITEIQANLENRTSS